MIYLFNKIAYLGIFLCMTSFVSCDKGNDPADNTTQPTDTLPGNSDNDILAVVINEVCNAASGAWIEIMNNSDKTVDISGWRIVYRNPGNQKLTLHKIPDDTSITPNAYRVFDKAAGTLSGTIYFNQSLAFYLISDKNDTVSVFDRDVELGANVEHPANASFARFPNASATWIITRTPTKGAENQNLPPPAANTQHAIWVRGDNFNSVNFQSLASNHINHVLVNEAYLTVVSYGNTEADFTNRIAAATAAGVKVHVWFQCFYQNGSWVNAIDVDKQTYNQAYYDQLISRAVHYVKTFNIAGIHLDYIRYPGTAYKYSYPNGVTGEKAITEFCRQISDTCKKLNPNIKLSAALMFETSSNAYYYGQNTRDMAKHIDILMPMVYRYGESGGVDRGGKWIFTTTRWFAAEATSSNPNSEVWPGLQTYSSDSPLTWLSATGLKADCRWSFINDETGGLSGSKGIVLFRYGIVNYFDMSTIYQ